MILVMINIFFKKNKKVDETITSIKKQNCLFYCFFLLAFMEVLFMQELDS